MVLNKLEYSKLFQDPDVYTFNYNRPLNERISYYPDIKFGLILAGFLKTKLDLKYKVCHNLNLVDDDECIDFIFSDDGWLDPGPYRNFEYILSDEMKNIYRVVP